MKTKICSECKTEKDINKMTKKSEGYKWIYTCFDCQEERKKELLSKAKIKICKICGIEKDRSKMKRRSAGYKWVYICLNCLQLIQETENRKKQLIRENKIRKRVKKIIRLGLKEAKNRIRRKTIKKIRTYRKILQQQKKNNLETHKLLLFKIRNSIKTYREFCRVHHYTTPKKFFKTDYWYYKTNYRKIFEQELKKYHTIKMLDNLRSRISHALQRNSKKASTFQLTGCSFLELKNYLEKQFKKGMSWDNYGKWHVDHIKPCASFDLSKPEAQRKCFRYTNLQPLWAKENLKKSDKLGITKS